MIDTGELIVKPPGPSNREESEEIPVAVKVLLVAVALLILSLGVGFLVQKWRVETAMVQMEMCMTYGVECPAYVPPQRQETSSVTPYEYPAWKWDSLGRVQ